MPGGGCSCAPADPGLCILRLVVCTQHRRRTRPQSHTCTHMHTHTHMAPLHLPKPEYDIHSALFCPVPPALPSPAFPSLRPGGGHGCSGCQGGGCGARGAGELHDGDPTKQVRGTGHRVRVGTLSWWRLCGKRDGGHSPQEGPLCVPHCPLSPINTHHQLHRHLPLPSRMSRCPANYRTPLTRARIFKPSISSVSPPAHTSHLPLTYQMLHGDAPSAAQPSMSDPDIYRPLPDPPHLTPPHSTSPTSPTSPTRAQVPANPHVPEQHPLGADGC